MENNKSGTYGFARFVVRQRVLITVLFIIASVLSVFTAGLVNVSDDLYVFLPESCGTKQALNIMENFTTYSTARVMVEDISYEDAFDLAHKIAQVKNVKAATFNDSEKHYHEDDGIALIDVSFAYGEKDEESLIAINEVRDILSDYDGVSVSTEVGVDYTELILHDMIFVGAITVGIVIALLLFTSRSFGEVPVLIMTFAVAALLQIGTNFVFGTISYIANSVTLILQLALAIDYAVILCNRFSEERQYAGVEEAMTVALSKAITEISASSLTTIGGLIAMMLMQFGMGADLGRVLIKSILISMLTVFLFMPGLLVMFSRSIDRSRHRSFMPDISAVGDFAWRTRKGIPIIFAVVLVIAFMGATSSPFTYNYSETLPLKLNEALQANKDVRAEFGYDNMTALTVPSGDYDTERAMLMEIAELDHVTSVLGLADIEAVDGYKLSDEIAFGEFAQIAGLDDISSEAMFAMYGAHTSDYDSLNELESYKVPLIDLFLFLYEIAESGAIELPEDKVTMIEDLYAQLTIAEEQLQSEDYSRMLIYSDLPTDNEESFALLNDIRAVAENYYDEVYLAGDTTLSSDLRDLFKTDNLMTSLLSALFVVLVIIFTFRSVGLALLLIMVIQGSIWINFSIPLVTGKPIFFLAYLIVQAIQMGANIDYAIVISNRYLDLREKMSKRAAITGALNGALPTLLTSGSILACAGLLIGFLTAEASTSAIGIALGRGTLISLALVIFVLPQILLLGDRFITKTAFKKRLRVRVPPRFRDDFEDMGRIHGGYPFADASGDDGFADQ